MFIAGDDRDPHPQALSAYTDRGHKQGAEPLLRKMQRGQDARNRVLCNFDAWKSALQVNV